MMKVGAEGQSITLWDSVVREQNICACVSHAGSAPTQFSHKILCVLFFSGSFFALGAVCETMEVFMYLWSAVYIQHTVDPLCVCVCGFA